MRKILSTFFVLMAMSVATQAPASIIISGVIDGPLTGGTPKAVELYVLEDVADAAGYSLDYYVNNGTVVSNSVPLTGAFTAGDFIYVTPNSAEFNTFFEFLPTFASGNSINGDDPLVLSLNSIAVDSFGVVGVDGTGQPWDYLDGWAYRNDSTGPDGSTFQLANWTFSGINALDVAAPDLPTATNLNSANPFPIGTYTATAIPEPTSFLALGLIAAGGLVVRRRRLAAKA